MIFSKKVIFDIKLILTSNLLLKKQKSPIRIRNLPKMKIWYFFGLSLTLKTEKCSVLYLSLTLKTEKISIFRSRSCILAPETETDLKTDFFLDHNVWSEPRISAENNYRLHYFLKSILTVLNLFGSQSFLLLFFKRFDDSNNTLIVIK